jgi:hypothetical protein
MGKMDTMNEKRPWVLVAVWFGTIALLGLLKRGINKRRPF